MTTILNDGILKIYQKVVNDQNSGVLDATPLMLVRTAFYGEISFSANEYYTAKQSGTAIERRVRIHQDKSLCNKHVIEIGETFYDVGRTYSTVSKGLAVTEITLERVSTQYDLTRV